MAEDEKIWFKAIEEYDVEVVKRFIEKGFNVNTRDDWGNSALYYIQTNILDKYKYYGNFCFLPRKHEVSNQLSNSEEWEINYARRREIERLLDEKEAKLLTCGVFDQSTSRLETFSNRKWIVMEEQND